MGRVCVVGSANLDLIALTERLPRSGETVIGHGYFEAAGGKGLNQAVAAARAGATVTFVGAVGDDDAGRTLRNVAVTDRIDVHSVRTVGDPTGRALIGVGDDGANLIIVVPGANGTVDRRAVEASAAAIESCDVLLVQHEIPDDGLLAALRLARAAGRTTVLNPAPARPLATGAADLVDIIVPNEHEYPLIGDVSGIRTLIVTEGERGALIRVGADEIRVPAYSVEAIDTVAAGDAFCGALTAALADGVPLDQAVRRGCAAGALATLVRGAVPSLPYRSAIDDLIARG